MSHTFVCTKEKEWYLKISSVEELLEYWNNVFNPTMEEALATLPQTREFGRGMNHCNTLQLLIGQTARGELVSNEEAYQIIASDMKIAQYQAILNGDTVFVNKKMGWNAFPKEVEQFVQKQTFDFPIMKKDKLKIEQFPLGTHYYVFIDGVQLRKEENLKFQSYEEAYEFAQQYLK